MNQWSGRDTMKKLSGEDAHAVEMYNNHDATGSFNCLQPSVTLRLQISDGNYGDDMIQDMR